MGSDDMRKLNEEFMKDYILSENFKNEKIIKGLLSLYKIFTVLEVKSIEDLKTSPENYHRFLLKNFNLLINVRNCSEENLLSSIDYVINSINTKIRCSTTDYIEDFAQIVKDIFPNQHDMHILDVGAGSIPYSAFLEGETFSHITTMDHSFYLPNLTMQNLNVNGVNGFFDGNTKVDKFDAVVGKQPCSAIEHIVRNCSQENKPYLIQLCNCNLPYKEKYIDEWYGWQDVLPDIDPNVKFYEDYAFNVDASEEQMKKIINNHLPADFYDIDFIDYNLEQQRRRNMKKNDIDFWLEKTKLSPTKNEDNKNTSNKKDDSEFLKMEMFERS